MVVQNFAALSRSSSRNNGGGGGGTYGADLVQSDAHRSLLHTAMRAACPKYASDGCFAGVPLPSLAPLPAALAPGTVLVQWQLHPNGSVKEPGSWATGGSLPASGLTDAQVLNLPSVPLYASMLFVLAPVATTTEADPAAVAAAAAGKKGATPVAAAGSDASALPAVSGERTFPVELVQELLGRIKVLRH